MCILDAGCVPSSEERGPGPPGQVHGGKKTPEATSADEVALPSTHVCYRERERGDRGLVSMGGRAAFRGLGVRGGKG